MGKEDLVHFSLFKTAFGTCAVSWDEKGIRRFQLPESNQATLIEKLAGESGRRSPMPPWVRDIADRIVRHLGGEKQDFTDVPLVLNGLPPFHQKVYKAARRIPAGKTLSYGELAKRVGNPAASRAVGQAMGKNPIPLLVPCHRVLTSTGKGGGFSAYGGLGTKARLLELEGSTFKP